MKKDYIRLNINGDKTLTSIANHIGITPQELKEFHNALCQKNEKIYFDNLKGLKFVLVPTDYKTLQEKSSLLEAERPSNHYSKYFLFKNYSILETYERPNGEDLSIRYSIHIDFPECEDSLLIHLSQTDFVNPNEKPSDKLTELSLLCMESLYPIPIFLSEDGKMLSIHHENLVQKFDKNRNKIEDFFIGDFSKQYLDLFYINLIDENCFFNQLKSSFLYQTIFPDMKWFHKNRSWIEPFYIHQNSFPMACTFEADYHHGDENIEVSIQGWTSEPVTLQEVLLDKKNEETTHNPMKGKINLNYIISRKDKTLLKAESTIMLFYGDELYESHRIEIAAKSY